MSIYGTCFDNGMSGRCNCRCLQFLLGGCEVGDEIVGQLTTEWTQEEIDTTLSGAYDEVTLFVLRGEGKTDLELLTKVLGY